MEKQLFDWKGWDQMDTSAFSFDTVVLKVQIGEFPAGTAFDFANVDFERGTLQLGNFTGEGLPGENHDFKIGLVLL